MLRDDLKESLLRFTSKSLQAEVMELFTKAEIAHAKANETAVKTTQIHKPSGSVEAKKAATFSSDERNNLITLLEERICLLEEAKSHIENIHKKVTDNAELNAQLGAYEQIERLKKSIAFLKHEENKNKVNQLGLLSPAAANKPGLLSPATNNPSRPRAHSSTDLRTDASSATRFRNEAASSVSLLSSSGTLFCTAAAMQTSSGSSRAFVPELLCHYYMILGVVMHLAGILNSESYGPRQRRKGIETVLRDANNNSINVLKNDLHLRSSDATCLDYPKIKKYLDSLLLQMEQNKKGVEKELEREEREGPTSQEVITLGGKPKIIGDLNSTYRSAAEQINRLTLDRIKYLEDDDKLLKRYSAGPSAAPNPSL